MAYTPELSIYHSALLRRLAWALKRPMTETLHRALDEVADRVDKHLVCGMCRDNSVCERCAFNGEKAIQGVPHQNEEPNNQAKL